MAQQGVEITGGEELTGLPFRRAHVPRKAESSGRR
jgi:hypothetical protein